MPSIFNYSRINHYLYLQIPITITVGCQNGSKPVSELLESSLKHEVGE